MGVMAEGCNLVSGFKVGLPEETEFKVKIQMKEGKKKKSGSTRLDNRYWRLKRGEHIELKVLKHFSTEWPKCEGKD